MQRLLSIACKVIKSLEISDEDAIQDIYLWTLQNQTTLNACTDDIVDKNIRVYAMSRCAVEEDEPEEFEDIYPSYDSIDALDTYFTCECIRDACNKLSVNKRTVIINSFGFEKHRPLTIHEMSLKFKLPVMTINNIKHEAINELREILKESF